MRVRIRGTAAQIGGPRVELESRGQQLRLDLGLDGGLRVSTLDRMDDRRRVTVGPFGVTAFMVDPSVHDASAIVVDADGVSVLYVGNLRAGILEKLLLTPPTHVDLLLMEGATIGTAASGEGFPSEADFEDKFAGLFRQTAGMPLVWCSAQNVERIVTIYRACLRTNRQFIVDGSTAKVLRAVAPTSAAGDVWDGVRVFVPGSERRARRQGPPGAADAAPRITSDELADAAPRSVILFRPALMQHLENARCLADARLIFSMWSGYLEYEKSNPVLEWLDRHGIPLDQCHTSGHAGIVELMELRRAFATAPVVPIGRHPDRFVVLFGRVERYEPGEWWEVSCVPRPS
jgi:ribonuclease J